MEASTTVTIQEEPPVSALASSTPVKDKPKKWVQFEDEAEPRRKAVEKRNSNQQPEALEVKILPQNTPAVLDTESIHINLSRSFSESNNSNIEPSSSCMSNVDLHDGPGAPTSNGVTSTTVPGGVIRQGFGKKSIVPISGACLFLKLATVVPFYLDSGKPITCFGNEISAHIPISYGLYKISNIYPMIKEKEKKKKCWEINQSWYSWYLHHKLTNP